MAIAKGLYTDGHYGGPGAVEPERLVAGRAAALRRRLLPHGRRAREGGAAARRAAGHRHDPAHLPARPPPRRARSPAWSPRCSPPPTPRSSRTTGRLLAEPVALFWLPAAMLAFLWASDGGSVVALAGARRAARADHAHAAGVPAVRRAVRAARARARVARPPRAGCCPGSSPRLLLVVAFCGVLAPWTVRNADRARPLRARHHGRRQGAVRRHLPARRRPPAARQAPADRAVLRQEGPPVHGGARRPDDGAAAQPGREEVPGARPRRRARRGSGARTSRSTPRSSRSTTPGW